MEVWRLVLYAAASAVALRILITLMVAHRAQVLAGLIADEQLRRKLAAKAARAAEAKASAEPPPAEASRRRAA